MNYEKLLLNIYGIRVQADSKIIEKFCKDNILLYCFIVLFEKLDKVGKLEEARNFYIEKMGEDIYKIMSDTKNNLNFIKNFDIQIKVKGRSIEAAYLFIHLFLKFKNLQFTKVEDYDDETIELLRILIDLEHIIEGLVNEGIKSNGKH